MKTRLISLFSVLLALFIGVMAVRSSVEFALAIFIFGMVLTAGLVILANYRSGNYIGIFFATFKGMDLKLNQIEKQVAIFSLSLMASPFLYMIGVSIWP